MTTRRCLVLAALGLLLVSGRAGADAWDPGDDSGPGGTALAPTATLQTHGPHTLDAVTDVEDWYAIPMVAGKTYHFDSVGGTGDVYAVLYSDSAGFMFQAWDDDSGGSLQFSFDFTAGATQTYWLAVYSFGAPWTGAIRYSTRPLRASVRLEPAQPLTGLPFQVVLSVTNSGAGDVTGVGPAMWFTVGGELVSAVSGPTPASVATIPAGGNATFVWVWTATANGWVDFTASVSGFDTVSGVAIELAMTDGTWIFSPARLEAGWSVVPSQVTPGQSLQLILTVENTGDYSASGVVPALQFNAGGSGLTWISGPSPAGPVTVWGGSQQRFTWVYQANGSLVGTVGFTATASGTDLASGSPVSGAAAGEAWITPLRAALSVAPGNAVPGMLVEVVLTVTNAGATAVNSLLPSFAVTTGAGLVTLVSGPLPPGPLAPLPAGGTASFTWTYSVVGTGVVDMTATASGVESSSGVSVLASARGSLNRFRVLFYGPTWAAGSNEESTPGIDATVWNAATWASKSTADFAAFDAIVFADMPPCGVTTAAWSTAVANRNVWGPAVTGDVIVIGTDPDYHLDEGERLVHQSVLFAASDPDPGPGLYVALSCVYTSAGITTVDLLGYFGLFQATTSGCNDNVHRVSSHPVLNGISDADLSNWSCSTHEIFTTWPGGFYPLAIAVSAVSPFPYAACDGTVGGVYILASGVVPICAVPVLHLSVSPPGPVCAQDTLTYALSWSNAGGDSMLDLTITDTIPAGVFYRSPTLAFWAEADTAGSPALTDVSWAPALSGPWSAGEPPDMTPGPLALRWVVDRCAPARSGGLAWQVTLDPALPAGSLVRSRGWATALTDAGSWTTETVTNIKEEVRVAKTGDVAEVVSGGTVTYTLGFVNCTTTAYNLTLWDTMPAGATLVRVTDGGLLSGSVLSWSIPVVPSFVTGSVSFTVSVTGPGAWLGPNVAGMDFLNSLFVPRPALWTPPLTVPVLRPVLSATKRVQPPVARTAETVVYEIVVTNTGADTGTALTVWDTLPNGLAPVSSTGGVWDGTKLDWTLPPLGPGASAVVSFTALVTSTGWTVGPNLGAGAHASSLGWPQPQALSLPVSLAVIRPAVGLVKSSDVPFTFNGGLVTYALGVFSTGTATAANLEVWDSLPPGTAFDSASAGGSLAGGLVVWSLGGLPPGATMALTLTVAVTSTGWDLGPNVAEGAYDNGWGVAGPRAASNPVIVPYNQPVLAMSKIASRMPAPAGSDLVYTLTLTNLGLDTAYAVSVWDSLPPGSVYRGCAGGTSCAWDGVRVAWSVPDLVPGAVVVLTVTVTADAAAGCPNVAEAAYANSKGLALPAVMSGTVCVPVVNSDVRMSVRVDRPVWSAGEPVAYSILVWNQGTDTAISITLSTTGVATTGVPAPWSATPAGTAVPGGHGWVLAPLPPGAGTTVWLSVMPPPPGCDPEDIWRWGVVRHENSAGLTQPEFPPVPVPVSAQLTGSAVSIWLTPAAPVVQRGATVTFTLSYSNPCSDTAWSSVVVAGVPSGLGLGPVTAGGVPGPGLVRWGLAPVGPGASGFVRFTVTASGPGPIQAPVLSSATFSNGAGLPQASVGPSATVYVVEPRLVVVKRGPVDASARDRFAYTIVVTNRGDDTAFDVKIVDTIPAPLGFIAGAPAASRSGALVWWSVTRLGIGESVQAGLVVLASSEEADAAPVNIAQATWRTELGVRSASPPDAWTVRLRPSLVVRVFPQPFDPAVSPLKITGIPHGATVRIYTLAGSEVVALRPGQGYRVVWDGRNAAGSPCAAGVYLYVIEPPEGPDASPAGRGKFGMIR